MKVLTIGTFDLLHIGHLELFYYGSKLGTLQIGINSDEFVERYKGQRPNQDYTSRRDNIVRYSRAEVFLNNGPGKCLIEKLKPDIILIGMDWHERDYLEQIGVDVQFINNNNILIVYAPRTTGVSSSAILETVYG